MRDLAPDGIMRHDHGRWWSCVRKKRYREALLAERAAGRARKRTGEDIAAYRCRYCPFHHIGHRPEGSIAVAKTVKQRECNPLAANLADLVADHHDTLKLRGLDPVLADHMTRAFHQAVVQGLLVSNTRDLCSATSLLDLLMGMAQVPAAEAA